MSGAGGAAFLFYLPERVLLACASHNALVTTVLSASRRSCAGGGGAFSSRRGPPVPNRQLRHLSLHCLQRQGPPTAARLMQINAGLQVSE
jgi:hypothetical protein